MTALSMFRLSVLLAVLPAFAGCPTDPSCDPALVPEAERRLEAITGITVIDPGHVCELPSGTLRMAPVYGTWRGHEVRLRSARLSKNQAELSLPRGGTLLITRDRIELRGAKVSGGAKLTLRKAGGGRVVRALRRFFDARRDASGEAGVELALQRQPDGAWEGDAVLLDARGLFGPPGDEARYEAKRTEISLRVVDLEDQFCLDGSTLYTEAGQIDVGVPGEAVACVGLEADRLTLDLRASVQDDVSSAQFTLRGGTKFHRTRTTPVELLP